VTQLITDLLAVVTTLINFASTFLLPAQDATTGAYTITLINVVVWVPLLMGLVGGAGSLIMSFARRRAGRRG
jgi:hypothetical protein